ncbi:MAG: TerB family tellurite resistance protein [Crocinitomicaceae bacterium]|nr:TerB family tellurite resistance protein [Crocinitomicaceae bacterium]
MKLAQSDDHIRDSEFQFLHTIADQLGVTDQDFKGLFDTYIKFTPPKLELDRIVQFQRLILLMNIDQDIDVKEMDYVRNLGIRMGLHPGATDEVLSVMHKYENKALPPEELLRIFKTFHN